MAQQGNQMRIGVCEGLAYNAAKLVSLAKGNRNEVGFNTYYLRGEVLYLIEVLPCSNSDLF
jgi:hypothetical protein